MGPRTIQERAGWCKEATDRHYPGWDNIRAVSHHGAEMDGHKQNSTDPLQVLREGMAVVISMVILGLAAWTIGHTFLAARAESVDAYNREKDIMLYVVSLFGTVTGYYLGRVPAEVNARRAEKAASEAQQQLSESQEKLGAATVVASTATAGEARASKRLGKAAGELRN